MTINPSRQEINPGDSGTSKIQKCLRSRDYNGLKLLVESGTDPRAITSTGYYPMATAALSGSLESISMLSLYCADFEPPTADTASPLDFAIDAGHDAIRDYLIQNGADVNFRYPDGDTILAKLCRKGDWNNARCLFNAGASLDFNDGAKSNTHDLAMSTVCLYEDIGGGLKHVQKGLCDRTQHRADIYRADAWRQMVFELSNSASRIAAKVFSFAVNPYAKLNRAIGQLNLDAVLSILADSGKMLCFDTEAARPTIEALYDAVRNVSHSKPRQDLAQLAHVTEQFLKNGMPIGGIRTQPDRRLLHLAVLSGNTLLCDVLLAHMARSSVINLSDSQLNRPAHLAIIGGFNPLLERLCAAGANVNCVNRDGLTPLHLAILAGDEGAVKILLAHQANVFLDPRATSRYETQVTAALKDKEKIRKLILAKKDSYVGKSIFSTNNPFTSLIRV